MARKWIIRGLAVALVAVTLWLLVSWAAAYHLTRRPRPWFAEPVPAVAWGKFQGLRLRSRDGQELGAWLVQGRGDGPSVVLLHGHRGSRTKCLDRSVLILAGARDQRARPAEARSLLDRVKAHGTLVIFPESDHVRMHVSDPVRYRQAVLGFLRSVERRWRAASRST
jgi:dipeptidyl aminopeptidase/acylaminoacyl peptidase